MPVAQEEVFEGNDYVRDGDDQDIYKVIIVGSGWETKDSAASNWHPAVVYHSTQRNQDMNRIRSITDFCAKFSKYVEPEAQPAD